MSSVSQPGPLMVTFADATWEAQPGFPFTFGRAGSIVIDSANRELHRVQGTFAHDAGRWWLRNDGRSASFVVADLAGASFTRVAPGTTIALPFARCAVSFSAGAANYRIEVFDPAHVEPEGGSVAVVEAEPTLTTGHLVFNEEQFLLLVSLAERRLDGPITAGDLPTNRQIGQRLGWKPSKVGRKLDNLCAKLDRAGVAGLRGDQGEVAKLRRLRLADFAVERGIVTAADLALLTPDG